jgi:A/G-specific adenine glycosylase
LASLQQALLSWYRARRRDLPWRRGVTPYRTWVSEIMLQQTTVGVVIPYYERFLARFPDVSALADAPEEDVLKLWAGLGYYSRARNLHKAAKKLVAERGGEFPSDFDSVLDLPGVGRYTAGAILSIAFEQAVPLVDGNVARVFSRLFGIRGDLKKPDAQKKLWALAEDLVDRKAPGDWNQALMELGATVCSPESPSCGACPVSEKCAAFAKGLQDALPEVSAKKAPVDLKWTCLWIERGAEVLLWKRAETERFLKGHWGLPEARHLAAKPGKLLKTAKHSITHHRISVEVREGPAPAKLPASARWVPRAELADFLVSSLWQKTLR